MYVESQNPQPSVNVYPGGGNNGFGSFGDMFGGMGGGAIFFWFILFFFMMMFMGGWGNNGNASPAQPVYMSPYMMPGGGGYDNAAQAVRSGFDQSAVVNGIDSIRTEMQNGFNNAEVSRCNQQANVLATLNNNQNVTLAALNQQAMALQNCCCENRAATADLKYAVATEACADRSAVGDAFQALSAQNSANTNAIMIAFNAGIQSIKDQMCSDKIDAKNERIASLERQLQMSQLGGMIAGAQQSIIANNDLQTANLEQYLDPPAKPAYIVQNPNGCSCRQCA